MMVAAARRGSRPLLRLCTKARRGHVSVRRTDDRETFDRIWALADWDYGPVSMAVAGHMDPEFVAQRVETRSYRFPPPHEGRALARDPRDWIYWLAYGGGSDEYLA